MIQTPFLATTFLAALREETGGDWQLYLKAIDAMRDAQAVKSGYSGRTTRRKIAFPIQRVSTDNVIDFSDRRKNK